ncbi:ATP-dependent helicase HrpB [Carboxylicivirga linearis]|uniref:ATP-dependent helicase HrpB n=1 Tax=Carboxylicivirga linearis TaxID=1628157 RepID=A0ABS5JRQ9_9BACT|nr:ATP-dependent helicase HrpB [Carboxylicivirga linearis]MBS2097574.1 ATP-dependent helicase HrpB [Carboxylicivirga linearis]
MKFDSSKIDLPIVEVIPEIKEQLFTNNRLIIHAPPGTGKSTIIPLALLDEPWLAEKKIIVLEPRRLAARSIAIRMADLLGEKVGDTVGYRIRFDNVISDRTRIEVVTEGILTRMLQSDNALEKVGAVIFDEFHERNLFGDLALALSLESQLVLRDDLRIIVMSATLDVSSLSQLLNSKVVKSEGRQYPVEIKYTGDADMYMIPELTARIVSKALNDEDGDILVFLPGEGEIRKCEAILKGKVGNTQIHPLYGQLNSSKQYAAIMPDKQGRRKIVLATSIAETSLTIEGVKVVVDSGFGRTMRFDSRSGLSRLETIEITKDSADQRAGRAGRLGPGVCYRMWTNAGHHQKTEHQTPEIEDADLASLMLDITNWGVKDIETLHWLTLPPKGHVRQAKNVLHQIEALVNGNITEHGKQLNKIPCHPRIAHMLLKAEEEGLSSLAVDVAAVLEERDPLGKDAGIDINLRIEALRRYRSGNLKNNKLKRIERVSLQYRKMLNCEVDNSDFDPYETGLLLAFTYPERIAHCKPGNNAQFKLANGRIAAAGHQDDLAHEEWLAIANLNATDGVGRIFLASPLNPRDLVSMVKNVDRVSWNTKDGGFKAVSELRIGSIVLQSRPLPDYDESAKTDAICDAIKKEGISLLNFNKEVVQWQNRVLSLRAWNKEQSWPDVSNEELIATCDEWLAPYLSNVKRPEDLKKINLKEVLQHHLTYDLQQQLDKLAPERIEVPSGSKIKIQYSDNGDKPVLAVRLQEVFGLITTPRVNTGKVSLLMHLLSPGFKPVQITGDLESFWNDAYFEVRKELRARYPKHEWPENPLETAAIRGVKRRN